jgi:hypothetical protein
MGCQIKITGPGVESGSRNRDHERDYMHIRRIGRDIERESVLDIHDAEISTERAVSFAGISYGYILI